MHQPAPPPVVRAAEVAALLNFSSERYFFERRRRLEADGFPRKLPGINGWSRAAILSWIETGGAVPHAVPADTLEARYAS